MSVYRTISRLFPGLIFNIIIYYLKNNDNINNSCFSAYLYMGMEYLRTNNLKTALLSFSSAKEINPSDPLIYNEIGVIYFKQKMYNEAKEIFL